MGGRPPIEMDENRRDWRGLIPAGVSGLTAEGFQPPFSRLDPLKTGRQP
jgi:hypothetical protein